MKKNTNIFKKITIATILATLLVTIPPTTYAQTTASALAVQMVNTSYNNKAEQASYKLIVDGVNKTSEVTFKVQNNRSMIGLRQFSNALGASVDWDNKKVAIVKKGSTTIEVPIGSKSVLVNNKQVPIDSQGTVSIIVDSLTYLPFRIVAESLGYTVSYDQNTKTITCTSSQIQQQPVEPVPEQGEYTHELGVIPEQYKNTTYAKVYNNLRRAHKLSEEHAKIVMASIKSFSPSDKKAAGIYSDTILRSKEDGDLQQNVPDPNRKGEWYMQPAGSKYPGWYWNGNNWEFNFAVYYGLGQ